MVDRVHKIARAHIQDAFMVYDFVAAAALSSRFICFNISFMSLFISHSLGDDYLWLVTSGKLVKMINHFKSP